MALSRSSTLHYWEANLGLTPCVGGLPVFSRASTGTTRRVGGVYDTESANKPCFDRFLDSGSWEWWLDLRKGAGAQADDNFYWSKAPAAQAMAVYLKFKQVANLTGSPSGHGLWEIGGTTGARLRMYVSGGVTYFMWYDGTTARFTQHNNIPQAGSIVEYLAILNADGSKRLISRVSGVLTGASDATTHALTAWGVDQTRLNVVSDTTYNTALYHSFKVVKLADLVGVTDEDRVNEVARFTVDLFGNVLS